MGVVRAGALWWIAVVSAVIGLDSDNGTIRLVLEVIACVGVIASGVVLWWDMRLDYPDKKDN